MTNPARPNAALSGLQALYLKRREERREHRYGRQVVLFLLAHPLLATAMRWSPWIPTAHALAVFGLGIYWLLRGRTPDRVIPLMGYIVGAEILWRGTSARIPWEFAKYSIAVLAMVALVRFSLLRTSSKASLVYFLLLVPSVFVLPEFDRGMVSFNLSGPFALALTTVFLSTRRLDAALFKRLLLSTLAPIIGLAALATFFTVVTENIEFGGSTRATSAGIGPNQVSSVLGLGALLAFLYLLVDRRHKGLRWFLLAAGLWLGAQSALTFSRGGMATCLGALIAGSFFLIKDRRSRGALVLRSAFGAIFAVYLLYPALDAFTDGALTRRFSSTHLTGRDKIIQGDLMAYRENPILGTGPGGSKVYHELFFRWSSAHTEYTRVLAEHGSAGLLALLILFSISAGRALRRGPPVSKAFAAAMTTWSLLYMFHSAMRLSAPAFLFGLGGVVLLLDLPFLAQLSLKHPGTLGPPVAPSRSTGALEDPGTGGHRRRWPDAQPALPLPTAASPEASRP